MISILHQASIIWRQPCQNCLDLSQSHRHYVHTYMSHFLLFRKNFVESKNGMYKTLAFFLLWENFVKSKNSLKVKFLFCPAKICQSKNALKLYMLLFFCSKKISWNQYVFETWVFFSFAKLSWYFSLRFRDTKLLKILWNQIMLWIFFPHLKKFCEILYFCCTKIVKTKMLWCLQEAWCILLIWLGIWVGVLVPLV